MDTLAASLRKHRRLKILDLRQGALRTRDVSSLVPLLTENKAIEELDISNAVISRKNMQHLWMALHMSVSVCTLIYSRINFLALNEIFAIDVELKLNKLIKDKIRPAIEKESGQTQIELSLRGFKISPKTNPALIKYIKLQQKLKSLDLSATGLKQRDLT